MSDFFEFGQRRLAVTTMLLDDQVLDLHLGTYEHNGRRHERVGESLVGEIPLEALLNWAIAQGYLAYEEHSP